MFDFEHQSFQNTNRQKQAFDAMICFKIVTCNDIDRCIFEFQTILLRVPDYRWSISITCLNIINHMVKSTQIVSFWDLLKMQFPLVRSFFKKCYSYVYMIYLVVFDALQATYQLNRTKFSLAKNFRQQKLGQLTKLLI